MSTQNDEKILTLRHAIAEKRTTLGKAPRFAPVTHCALELYGTPHNLHALKREDLERLAIQLQAYEQAALALGLDDTRFSGYTLREWLSDVAAKIAIFQYNAEKAKLDALEKQLSTLLSDDKRTELAIADIAAALK